MDIHFLNYTKCRATCLVIVKPLLYKQQGRKSFIFFLTNFQLKYVYGWLRSHGKINTLLYNISTRCSKKGLTYFKKKLGQFSWKFLFFCFRTKIKNLRLHNVRIHTNFYQKRFLNECARKKIAKIPDFQSLFFFYRNVERSYVL